MARSDGGAGENIAGIMDAIVHSGETYKAGDGQHETNASAVIDQRHHRRSEPIRSVSGGHAVCVHRWRIGGRDTFALDHAPGLHGLGGLSGSLYIRQH